MPFKNMIVKYIKVGVLLCFLGMWTIRWYGYLGGRKYGVDGNYSVDYIFFGKPWTAFVYKRAKS